MASTAYDPAVSDLPLVIVFQLGVCVLLLGSIANATHGYETTLGLLGMVVGSLTAAGAVVAVFVGRRLRAV